MKAKEGEHAEPNGEWLYIHLYMYGFLLFFRKSYRDGGALNKQWWLDFDVT